MTPSRTLTCAYGPCLTRFASSHPRARYCSGRCKAADWKLRTGYGHQRTVRAENRRPGGAQMSRGPAITAAVQLAYFLRPALAEQPEFAEEIATRFMTEAPPARQRARLLEREAGS